MLIISWVDTFKKGMGKIKKIKDAIIEQFIHNNQTNIALKLHITIMQIMTIYWPIITCLILKLSTDKFCILFQH